MEKKFRVDDKELNLYLSIVSTNRKRRKELLELKKISLISKLLSVFVGPSRVLDKNSISMADLPASDQKLDHASIKQAIQNAVVNLIQNENSNRKLLRRVTNVYALFHQIVVHVVRREIFILKLLDILQGIFLLSFLMTFIFFVLPTSIGKGQSAPQDFMTLFNTLFFLLSMSTGDLISQMEDKLRLKIELIYKQLVYDKLLATDASFLNKADNNLIYKLLYEAKQDYCGYLHSWFGLCPLLIPMVGVGFSLLYHFHITSLIVTCLLVFDVCFFWLIEVRKMNPYLKYKTTTFEQRKVFYEFIFNFKVFVLNDLKPRFESILNNIRELRNKKLRSVGILSCIDFNNVFNWHKVILLAGGIWMGYLMECYWSISILFSLFKLPFVRFSSQSKAYLRHRSSISILQHFFEADFLAEEINSGEGMTPGSIIFENCDILQRDEENIDQVLKDLLKNESSIGLLHTTEKKSVSSFISLLSQKVSLMVRKEKKLSQSIKPNKLKLVLSGFNLNIEPGQKVCIFDNKNKTAIKAFLEAIKQNNLIGEGRLMVGGSISVLKIKEAPLLVGQTIRSNILYGHEYNQERYDKILRALNCQFANYKGQDMHQVCENGWNIRNDDKRSILFARFLYSESDIYILEDFLAEIQANFMINHIAKIFSQMLEGKTIIYVSSSLEAMRLADKIISLESECLFYVISARQYFGYLENQHAPVLRSLFEVIDSEDRRPIFSSKLKNCIFVAHISYEEELAIYKKLEKKKAFVQQMKDEKRSVMEFLSYGFFLSHQKREEGKYLDDEHENTDPKVCFAFLKSLISRKDRIKLVFLFIFLCLVPKFLFLATERIAFSFSEEFIYQNVMSSESDSQKRPLALIFLGTAFFLNILWNYTAGLIHQRLLSNLMKQVQDSILHCLMNSILNKRSHRILDTINKDFMHIEHSLPELLRNSYSLLPEILLDLAMLSYLLSFWNIIVYAAIGSCFIWLLRKVSDVYSKSMELNAFIDSKFDDLNFQILSLIGSMRIGGLIEQLKSRIGRLSDNFVRTRIFNDIQLKASLRVYWHVFHVVGLGLLIGLQFALIEVPKLNFVGVNFPQLLWASLLIFRMFGSLQQLPELYTHWLHVKISVVKVVSFLMKQQRRKEEAGSLRKLNYSIAFQFKKVSVTIGQTPLFKKLSFKIKNKRKYALVGIEGSGRFGIFELITKVMKADDTGDSQILLFGVPLEEISENVIKKEVFVLEKIPALFEGTVRNNIDPHDRLSDQQIIAKIREIGVAKYLDFRANPKNDEDGELIRLLPRPSVHEQIKRASDKSNSQLNGLKVRSSTSKNSQSGFQPVQISRKDDRKVLNRGITGKNNLDIGRNLLKYALASKSKTDGSGYFERLEDDLKNENLKSSIQIEDREPISVHKKMFMRSGKRIATTFSDQLKPKKIEPIRDENMATVEVPAANIHRVVQSAHQDDELDSIKTMKKTKTSNKNPKNQNESDKEKQRISPSTIDLKLDEYHSVASIELELKDEGQGEVQSLNSKDHLAASNTLNNSVESKQEEQERCLHMAIGLASTSLAVPKVPVEEGQLKSSVLSRDFPNTINDSKLHHHVESNFAIEVPDNVLLEFISRKVGFGGKNIDQKLSKMIIFVRALFEKPRLLLLFEETLNFGKGVAFNLQTLSSALPDTTIVSITRNNANLLLYDKILFIDAGKIIEQGKPIQLIANKNSYLRQFVAEADKVTYSSLKQKVEEIQAMKIREKSKNFAIALKQFSLMKSTFDAPSSFLRVNVKNFESDGRNTPGKESYNSNSEIESKTKERTSLLQNAEIRFEVLPEVTARNEEDRSTWSKGLNEFEENKPRPYSSQEGVHLPDSRSKPLMKDIKTYICMEKKERELSVPSLPDDLHEDLENLSENQDQIDIAVEINKLKTIQEMPENFEVASSNMKKADALGRPRSSNLTSPSQHRHEVSPEDPSFSIKELTSDQFLSLE